MPVNYYIKRGEKVRGPLSRLQIQNLKAQGKLKASDLISTRSDGGWKPVPGARNQKAATIPELPGKPAREAGAQKTPPRIPIPKHRLLLKYTAGAVILLVSTAMWMPWSLQSTTTTQSSPETERTAEIPESTPAAGKMEFTENPTQPDAETPKPHDAAHATTGAADSNHKQADGAFAATASQVTNHESMVPPTDLKLPDSAPNTPADPPAHQDLEIRSTTTAATEVHGDSAEPLFTLDLEQIRKERPSDKITEILNSALISLATVMEHACGLQIEGSIIKSDPLGGFTFKSKDPMGEIPEVVNITPLSPVIFEGNNNFHAKFVTLCALEMICYHGGPMAKEYHFNGGGFEPFYYPERIKTINLLAKKAFANKGQIDSKLREVIDDLKNDGGKVTFKKPSFNDCTLGDRLSRAQDSSCEC